MQASPSSPADLLLPATALVVVRGPDARHARGLGCPLAVTEGGATTVTCSGVLLPSTDNVPSTDNAAPCRVLAPASAIAPFVDSAVSPTSSLVAGTTLSVSFPSCSFSSLSSSSSSFRVAAWLKLPGADAALSRLSREGWETGWALSLAASPNSTSTLSTSTALATAAAAPSSSSLLSPPPRPPPPSAAWLVVLEGQGPAPFEAASAAALLWNSLAGDGDGDDGGERPTLSSSSSSSSSPLPPGTPLLAAGAPLGGLSAPHFAGCVLSGAVSAVVSDDGGGGGGGGGADAAAPTPPPPLLLADLPSALPGADGGPVVAVVAASAPAAAAAAGEKTTTVRFAGVLAPPLRQGPSRSAAAAAAPSGLPLVVAAGPLARALREAGMLWPRRSPAGSDAPLPPRPPLPLPPLPPPLVAASAASARDANARFAVVEGASRSVVALLVPGSSWASAVHVGGGVFLTARHALSGVEEGGPPKISPPPPRVLLQLRPPGGSSPPSWEPAEVDQRPLPPLARGLDVAVVRLRRSRRGGLPTLHLPPAARLARSVPAAAAPVAALGFPRVHPRAKLGPLATFGVVARTLAAGNGSGSGSGSDGEKEMLLSTCGVVAGASGGAVVDLSSAADPSSSPFPAAAAAAPVVALVVSNTRHLASGRTLAHLNYAVCGAALRACWEHALELSGGGGGAERRGSDGGGVGGSSRGLHRMPDPPSAEARATLWALAAVPRNNNDGGGEEGAEGKNRRGPQGRAALDRLLEKAGLSSSSSSAFPSSPAAHSDWPSRL